jgi:hypothetical protein
MVHAAWMEKIMSKTNHTSRLATLENHHTIEDTELDAVTGGNAVNGAVSGAATGCTKANGSGSWLEALATAMGQAVNSQL